VYGDRIRASFWILITELNVPSVLELKVMVNDTVCELLVPAGTLFADGCVITKDEFELVMDGTIRLSVPLPTLST